MALKGAPQSKRRSNLYALAVIIVSVLTVTLLLSTIFSRLSSSKDSLKVGKSAVTQLSNGFSCIADVNLGGTAYEVKLQEPSSGNCTMTFIKPAELNSLSFEQSSDGLKVKFGTLEAAVDPSSIPQSSIFNAVSGSFNSCIKDGVNANMNNGTVNLTGKSSVGNYALTLGSDLKPKSLSIPSLKMNATFKNFEYGS